MHTKKIAAIILAAGFSSRMNTFKPLLPIGSATVIERSVSSFIGGGITDIKVVLGHRAQDIIPIIETLNVDVVVNENYPQGMYSSVQAGVQRLAPDTEAFFLLPCDTPVVQVNTIKDLMTHYFYGKASIVYPSYLGKKGHPPLISSALVPSILKGEQPGGLKEFLKEYESQSKIVDCNDRGIVFDIDTPADYQRVKTFVSLDEVPDLHTCMNILSYFHVPDRVRDHSLVVAQLAHLLAYLIQEQGVNINVPLVFASGLLHDIAKGGPDHARLGSGYLKALNYARVAEIVGVHMDLDFGPGDELSEAALLYLADKMTKGNRLVSIRERFGKAMKAYGDNPYARANIERRQESAKNIAQKISLLIDDDIENLCLMQENIGDVETKLIG